MKKRPTQDGAIARRDFVKTVAAGAAASSALMGAACLGGASPAKAAAASSAPRVGINLAGLVDWNTELPFVDVFRTSRPWLSQREGAAYAQGPTLELDRWGWV